MKRARWKAAALVAALGAIAFAYARFAVSPISYLAILDLQRVPQDAAAILPPAERLSSSINSHPLSETFFSAWDAKPLVPRNPDGLNAASYRECYSEALQPRGAEWGESQINNSQFRSLNSLGLNALVVHTTNLRGLPTDKPCFADPRRAGEGYPFDYLQLTSLYLGTPVRISHVSRDEQWAYLETSVGDQGWVSIGALARVDAAEEARLRSQKLVILLQDDLPFDVEMGKAIERTRAGMILPGGRWPEVVNGQLRWRPAKLPAEAMLTEPLQFTRDDLVRAVNLFLGQPYGWGDSQGGRDCSGLIRDFYALFGMLVPPSSVRALRLGKARSIEGKSVAEKRLLLREIGVPFRTLIGRKGHIAIYAGTWNGEPLLFHTLWGLKLGSAFAEGRALIGRAVLTTAEPGRELLSLSSAASILGTATDLTTLEP